MKKRLLSLLLVLVLLLQLSGGALAAIGDYIGNTPAENQEIYDQLAALTGGTSDEARALLSRLGLLDKDGNLDLTASITMDGKSMTVDEVRKLLAEPGIDLTKIANVDGMPLSLGDLQTILNIEAELARIQATYFSGKTFGADATDNLNSLMTQIETQGIGVNGAAAVQTPYLVFSLSELVLAPTGQTPSNFTITLGGLNGQPLAQTVSFKIRFKDANARTGTSLSATGGANFSLSMGQETTVTILRGAASDTSINVTVTPGANPERCLDTGKHLCYLEFTDGVGVAMNSNLSMGITLPISQLCNPSFTWNSITNGASYQLDLKTTLMEADTGTLGNSATELILPVLPVGDAQAPLTAAQKKTMNDIAFYLQGVDLYQRKLQMEMSSTVKFSNYVTVNINDAVTIGGKNPMVWDNGEIRHNVDKLFMRGKDQAPLVPTFPAAGTKLAAVENEETTYIKSYGNNGKGELNGQLLLLYFENGTAPNKQALFAPANHNVNGGYTDVFLTTKIPDSSYVLDNPVENGLAMSVSLSDAEMRRYPEETNHSYQSMKNKEATETINSKATYKNHFHGLVKGGKLQILDSGKPSVQSVTAARGTYMLGQIVPIRVTFDEPVSCNGLSIVANGQTVQTCACNDTKRVSVATTHTFHYPVQRGDATQVIVTSVSGGKDPFGNAMNNPTRNYTLTGVTLDACFTKDAVKVAEATKATLSPTEAAGGTQLKLTLDQAIGYKTKYTNYPTKGVTAPYFARLVGGDGTLIPFQLQETGDTVSAVADTGALRFDTTAKTYTYQIVCHEQKNNAWDKSTVVNTGKTVAVTVNPMVFVNGLTVEDKNDKRELSLTDSHVPTLTVKFTGSPTYQTGAWSSSDMDIATIDGASGVVTLAGKKLGEVKFTFTADDGGSDLGLDDPTPAGKVKSADSAPYTVTAGGEAGIVVPKGGDSIIALENSKAQVRWYGNMAQYLVPENSDHVKYTVEVFEGNITTEAGFTGKTAVHTAKDLPMTDTSYEIPVEILKNLSIDTVPAYTVRISTLHPNATIAANGIKLYAYAYIIVNPIPVKVTLTRPESLYALDSAKTASVGWTIENYNALPQVGTTAKLTVERVPETGATEIVLTQDVTADTGTASFTPEKVTGLRDLYVVTVKAQNAGDTVWNSDSYQFYVYNSNALDIVVGEPGAKEDSILLSNRDKNMDSLPADTDAIMALRDKLGLNAPIGINYSEYAWSALKDGIAWKSEDDSKVSLNFKQGSFYEDIKRFGYGRYLPETSMAIAGLGETSGTKITATHANTGMETTLDVKVESLQNRLYLFQTTPMLETTLTYTDGKGVSKSVKTNNKGTLALYEPDGIKGPVYLRTVDTADKDALYLGTISAQNLHSGEGNTLLFELYPLNSITLRKVARTDLYLKKPNGTPYTGSVTLRGGVYKNGGYCQEAQFGINTKPLVDGTKSQTVEAGEEGKLTLQMDITQFWSKEKGESADDGKLLKSTDKLEYIFELTDMSGNCPALVYVNGVSPVEISSRTGEGVVTLDKSPGKAGIFLAIQRTFDKNGDTRSVRYRPDIIGPNEVSPKGTELVSTMLLWGEAKLDTKDYSVQLLDEFGFQPPTQKSQTITYPFSSIPVVRNTMTLTPETLTESGWVPEGQPRGIKLQVLKNGTLQQDIPTDIKVADLSKVPPLKGDTTQNIMVELTNGSAVSEPPEMSNDNKVVDGLMKRLSGDGESISGPVDTSNFKMIISPGDDSATFKAFIWAGHNSLGLEDAEYDAEGLSVTPHLLEDELSTGFGGGDAAALASGAQEAAKTGADLAKSGKSVSGGGSFGGQLEGYYECLIKFNFKTQKWEIFTLGGGFTVGFGGSFGKTVNQMVGPIPITASFELGAAIQLDFKMASRYKVMGVGLEWSDSYKDKQYVSDFLTTLRINAYFEAFGGIGFDISIVALKFGVFGRLGVDNSNAFLSRTYLKDENKRQVNGQALKLTGEVGIEFVLTVIGIIDYQATLASIEMAWTKTFRDWGAIQDYWKNTGSGLSLGGLAAFGARNGLTLVDASASLQSRDYLEDFDRTWGAPRRMSRMLDPTSGLLALQSNAHPNSRPYVTDDGKYLLYTSDQDSSELTSARVYASEKKNDGTYPEGAVITAPESFEGFGDSDLRLAGKENLAVAAWVRQNTGHQLKAGDPVTPNTQSVLTNATEIVASVNTGSGWTSTRLTENGSPDLAPVVAANGDKAIVAWRSVYAADAAKPMDFTAQDKVLYKIYDKTENKWSDAKTLYPGTSGVVKGIEAAMLPDGTAAVTYVLDRSGTGDASTYEVAATIVDATTGEPGRTLMLTSDNYSDENPQIAAVNCGTTETPDPRFIIGWYSTKGEGGDIRMAALDANGLPSASFPESLGQIAKETMIGNNFRFVAADKLEDLSILWSATSQDQTQKGDQLLGVKFLPEGGKIGLSAPIDIATLPAHNNTDHFDAYVSDAATNEIKAVIQGTEYGPITEDPNTYHSYEVAYEDPAGNKSTEIVKTPKGQTMLYTATESYKNKLTLTQVWADYANLAVNSLLPVQFTVQNSGFEQLNSVSVVLDGKAPKEFPVNLAPNESATLTLYHAVGPTVADVAYSITPSFAGSSPVKTDGKLHLDYPDLGIAGLKVIAENKGQRDLRITLYNGGAAKLQKANRSINIAFYDDSLMEDEAVDITYGGKSTKKITISDLDQLTLADNGALCVDLSFNVNPYKDATTQELPPEGVRLYAKVWVEKSAKELPEFHKGNNTASVQLDSLLHRAGEPVTITVAQSLTEAGKTKADITVRNNSLKSVDGSGNVIATLLDKNGNVLETQQSYKPESKGRTAAPNGLLTLAGEESAAVDFTFSQPGASVKVTYGALVLNDDKNAALTSLSATGIPVRLADFEVDPKDATKFTAKISTAAGKTLVTALTQDPRATVTVNGAAMPQGGTPLALSSGENKITIAITAKDGTTKRTYEILAERTTSDPDADPITYPITATAGPGGSIAPKGTSRVARSSSKTYTITPDKGYAIADVLVDGVSAGKVSAYTFAKVKEKHSIEARFAPIALAFTDVAQTDWFYSAVEFVAQKNLMKGVGKNLFAPLSTSSRATVATVLYRMAGSPAVTGAPGFGDVPAGKWHSDAITWAAANGIAQGNGKEFAPHDDVSREQLAQLFYNYAKLKKYDLTPAGDLSKFTDAPTGWSREAVAWAVGSGILAGRGKGILDPTGKATRAELATMLMRLQALEK